MATTANSGAEALRNTDVPTISGINSNQDIAASTANDAVSRFWRAYDGYNADQIPQGDFEAAWQAMTAWEPQTHRDFVRKTEALFTDGVATAEDRMLLLQQAAAQLGGERCGREG